MAYLFKYLKEVEKIFGLKNEINWKTSIYLTSIHFIGLYWCWNYAFPVKWQTVILAGIALFVAMIGITCGAHRYFTHRTYKVTTVLKCVLIFCFTMAGQNSIFNWVRDHRLHHKHSDTEADPHNARRGLFFSHIGWLMSKKNTEVLKQGKTIDMSNIVSDKYIMFQEKYFPILKLLNCFILPTVVGIWLCDENWRCSVAWQCFIRHLLVLHNELTVNSLAHAFGYKPYNKNILPAQNRLVSFLAVGEGWHNYHHVFPYDYKAAEQCDILNSSTFLIQCWAKLGWAYDLKEPTPEMINSVMKRLGDGNHIFVKNN